MLGSWGRAQRTRPAASNALLGRPCLSSSCVPRRNRSIRLGTAGKRRDMVRSNRTGNTAVMRLRSRRWRRLRPRLQLHPKTDQGPSAPTTHSRGSKLPMPSRRRLPPRPKRSESVSCHHPKLNVEAIPRYDLHLVNRADLRTTPWSVVAPFYPTVYLSAVRQTAAPMPDVRWAQPQRQQSRQPRNPTALPSSPRASPNTRPASFLRSGCAKALRWSR
jgi:hypothetical protein